MIFDGAHGTFDGIHANQPMKSTLYFKPSKMPSNFRLMEDLIGGKQYGKTW